MQYVSSSMTQLKSCSLVPGNHRAIFGISNTILRSEQKYHFIMFIIIIIISLLVYRISGSYLPLAAVSNQIIIRIIIINIKFT